MLKSNSYSKSQESKDSRRQLSLQPGLEYEVSGSGHDKAWQEREKPPFFFNHTQNENKKQNGDQDKS